MNAVRGIRHHLILGLTVAAGLSGLWAAAMPAQAAPRWKLIYYRQIGWYENANRRTIENHVFHENGSKGSNIGITNQSNANIAVFGNTNADGWNRINPLDPNNCFYDIRIRSTHGPADNTPNFYWQNKLPEPDEYSSYITHWLFVSDDSRVTAYPQTPCYHYDQVNGINQPVGLNASCMPTAFNYPSGIFTDQKTLTTSAAVHAQTFVVPPNINRIVSAMAFVTRSDGQKFFYRASIRQGGPNGPQVGSAVTSREVFSTEFKEVAVNWPLQDVQVTPGETYALRLESIDGQGFNAYATLSDNYPNGVHYVNGTAFPSRDLLAVVVGVKYDDTPVTIVRTPASFTRNVLQGSNLPNDSFTVANGGGAQLDYSIGDNVNWLSVSPTSGSSTGEADTITISYDTAGLPRGSYTGVITISAPGAINSPQTIAVNLTVDPILPDFDGDNDVDQSDFGRFQVCYSGPGVPQPEPACLRAKLDNDDDVDGADFIKFANCLTGPGGVVSPACVE